MTAASEPESEPEEAQGRVTGYLFTDIAASTEKWERAPDAMGEALARHNAIIDSLVLSHGGQIRDRAGDGAFAVFETGNPLDCAIALQLAIGREDWRAIGGLAMRIGVHCSAGPFDQVSANRTHRMMMSAWGGQVVVSAAALGAYEVGGECEFADLGMVRLKGVDEPIRLFSLTHSAFVEREFPPLRDLATQSPIAPLQLAPIFGRQGEIEHVNTLLAQGRVVTIAGPGGNGKTRLALEIAAASSQSMLTSFVAADTAEDSAQLARLIASCLRLPVSPDRSARVQICDYLQNKAALIVIDNADGLGEGGEFLGALTSACRSLRLLVTRREPLGAEGETVVRLNGLAQPQGEEDFLLSPAALLFTQAARAAAPDFAFEARDRAAFCEICEAVAGSPLALRFIAQWVHLLTLEEIKERLKGASSLLQGPDSRGRNWLAPVFDASWALLEERQRSALGRLCVFEGGFDLQAAAAVAHLALEEMALFERKCLIERRENRRFVLHPLVFAYARGKLEEKGELKGAQRAHAHYYAAFLSERYKAGRGVEQAHALATLRRDMANIAAAFSFLASNGETTLVRTIAEPLFYTLVLASEFALAVRLFSQKTGDKALDDYLSAMAANCLIHQGRADEGEALANALAAQDIKDALLLGHIHQALGACAHVRGDFADAHAHYERALCARLRPQDATGAYFSAISLAWLCVAGNDLERAAPWVRQAYGLCQQAGHLSGAISVHECAGIIALRQGRAEEAERAYGEALRIEEGAPNPQRRASILINVAALHKEKGAFKASLERYEEALELTEAIGDRRMALNARIGKGQALAAQIKIDAAKAAFERALKDAYALGVCGQIALVLAELAHLEAARGDQVRAARLRTLAHHLDANTSNEVDKSSLPSPSPGKAKLSADEVEQALHELMNEQNFGALRL